MNRASRLARIDPGMKWLLAAGLLLGAVALARAGDLVVVHVAPYSGPGALVAREYGAGARLYFDHVNAQGGVFGSRVRLVSRDDAGDPERTSSEAMAAASDQPVAFIGAVGTDNVKRMIPALEKLQVPLLGAVVDAAGVSATRDAYVFHVRPGLRQEVNALAGELHALGMRRITLCAGDSANDSPADVPDAAASTIVTVMRCGGDAGAIVAAARAIAATNAQAVIYAGPPAEAARFVEALRAGDSFAMIVTTSAVDPRLLTRALPRAARSWLAVAESVPNPRAGVHAAAAPIVREFLATREADGSEAPVSRESLAGFMTAKVTIEAIRRAGENPSSLDVRAALDDMHAFDIGGITVDFQRRERLPSYVRLGIVSSTGAVLN